MNLKNSIKSKQIQTVRHNPDKDSCLVLKGGGCTSDGSDYETDVLLRTGSGLQW